MAVTGTIASPRPLGLTEALANDLASTQDRLMDRVVELDNLAERIFGTVPQAPEAGKPESPPVCVADVLQSRVRALRYVADRLEAVTTRLNQLV